MKRVVVTGASRGIGNAVARMLHAEGWDVVGLSRTKPVPVGETRWRWIKADVKSLTQVQRAFRTLGCAVDAVVHCAGIREPYRRVMAGMPPATWEQIVNVNLHGAHHVVWAALPLLAHADDARILLFSGGGAFDPSPGYSAYAVSKAGVVSLMETLALELAPVGVTVNCVAPGYVPTTIHDPRTLRERGTDDGEAMAVAVECVRHLLAPSTRGLTGKTVSAVHDDWRSFDPLTVDAVNGSTMGTRTRTPIQRVRDFSRRATLAAL